MTVGQFFIVAVTFFFGFSVQAIPMNQQSRTLDGLCSAKVGSCDYYQCAEKYHRCGREGYYQKFGHPYCSMFLSQTIGEVSPQGREWILRVGRCLQQKLAFYSKESDPCWFIEQLAISTHAECYVEAGGCELDVSDLVPVVQTFWREFADSRVFWQGIDYVAACAQRY